MELSSWKIKIQPIRALLKITRVFFRFHRSSKAYKCHVETDGFCFLYITASEITFWVCFFSNYLIKSIGPLHCNTKQIVDLSDNKRKRHSPERYYYSCLLSRVGKTDRYQIKPCRAMCYICRSVVFTPYAEVNVSYT